MNYETRKEIHHILFIVASCAITLAFLFYLRENNVLTENPPLQISTAITKPANIEPETVINPTENYTETELPITISLPVPFTPQAPTGNWDTLHNEACEEAVAIMSHAYFSGNTSTTLTPIYVEAEIKKLTEWQDKNFGYHLDSTSEETAKMITEVYNLNTKVIAGIDETIIKQALSENNLVLISTDGRLLGNPNYKQPGPPHHMLVIRGYNEKSFVTNDSGTKRGLNYIYSYTKLYNASGDWNHNTKKVDTVNKKMIIVSKNDSAI